MKYITLPRFPQIWDEFDTLTRNLWNNGETAEYRTVVVDVLEKADHYHVEAELPGFTEKEVEVSVKDQVLTISSNKTEEKKVGEQEQEEPRYLLKERRPAQFQRAFKLPKDADALEIQAVFKNGVLTLRIPRKKEAQPRSITIKSE